MTTSTANTKWLNTNEMNSITCYILKRISYTYFINNKILLEKNYKVSMLQQKVSFLVKLKFWSLKGIPLFICLWKSCLGLWKILSFPLFFLAIYEVDIEDNVLQQESKDLIAYFLLV